MIEPRNQGNRGADDVSGAEGNMESAGRGEALKSAGVEEQGMFVKVIAGTWEAC